MRKALWALVFASAAAVLPAAAASAQSDVDPGCVWVRVPPPGHMDCSGGGGGSDPPGEDPPSYTKGWGAWTAPGTQCTINGGPNDGLQSLRGFRWLYWIEGPLDGQAVNAIDLPGYGSGDVVPNAPLGWDGSAPIFAADGYAYDTGYCIDPGVTWNIYEEIEKRAPVPGFSRDPQVRGLVGLEQWVWYTSPTTIPTFYLNWTDPVTGIDFELEAQARIESYRWDFGDGTVITSYTPGTGPDNPSATHIYEQKGAVTVEVAVQWIGEYRIYQAGTVPGPWNLVPNGPTFTATDTLTVVEVRGCLGAACP